MRDGDGLKPGRLGILHAKVTETADTYHRDSLVRFGLGDSQSAPYGIPGAEDRSCLLVRESLRQKCGRVRVGQHVFGVATLSVDTCIRLLSAE